MLVDEAHATLEGFVMAGWPVAEIFAIDTPSHFVFKLLHQFSGVTGKSTKDAHSPAHALLRYWSDENR